MTLAIIGGLVVVGMAYTHDATNTAQLVTAVISIRGITWLVKKVTCTINLEHSQIIDFTGWSIAGLSIIKILANAKMTVEPALNKVAEFSQDVINISMMFQKFAEIADKVTFWN